MGKGVQRIVPLRGQGYQGVRVGFQGIRAFRVSAGFQQAMVPLHGQGKVKPAAEAAPNVLTTAEIEAFSPN